MRRRIIVFWLAAMLCAVPTGCGKDTGPAAPAEAPAEYTEAMDEAPAETVEPAVNGNQDESYSVQSEEAVKDDFGRVPEDETVSWDEMASVEEPADAESVSEGGEIEGIIAVQADWTDLYCPTYTVIGINPENGLWHNISNFYFDSVFEKTNPEYTIVPALQFGRFANLYDQFSSDYTKAAATKTFASNGEIHAGWITTDGNFFDVTEALDEQSHSDFDDAVSYQAVGFQNNVFIYVHSEGFEKNQYYGVSVDNVIPGASWEISTADSMICEDYATWQYIRGYKPTDWIDDDRLIVESNRQSCIATISTQSRSEYIPAKESRYSWSAVINPGDTKVAFLSEAKAGTAGDVGIYIMPLDGSSNPVRLETDFVPCAGAFSANSAGCYILEWR